MKSVVPTRIQSVINDFGDTDRRTIANYLIKFKIVVLDKIADSFHLIFVNSCDDLEFNVNDGFYRLVKPNTNHKVKVCSPSDNLGYCETRHLHSEHKLFSLNELDKLDVIESTGVIGELLESGGFNLPFINYHNHDPDVFRLDTVMRFRQYSCGKYDHELLIAYYEDKIFAYIEVSGKHGDSYEIYIADHDHYIKAKQWMLSLGEEKSEIRNADFLSNRLYGMLCEGQYNIQNK